MRHGSPSAAAPQSSSAINPKLNTSFPRALHVEATTAVLYELVGHPRKALSKPGNSSQNPGFLCSN
jgi:hypothetical protein